MTAFQILAALVVLAALASYLNHRFLHMPATIGLMVIALGFSVLLVLLGKSTAVDITEFAAFVVSIDFSELLLHGMLAFLLFAGALHVDAGDLRGQALPVAVLSTLGVALAALFTGTLLWWGAGLLDLQLTFMQALLFGVLISPTDPIAVLGILRQTGAPKNMETVITGESLFNDGVGVVLFLTVLGMATGENAPQADSVLMFLGLEALGGALFGFGLGWVGYRLLCTLDAYAVEVFITLAIAIGGYALAEAIHVSAPIAIVVAGLVIGNIGRSAAMSDQTREHVDSFWELIDEMMNAVLFMLIGLEVIAIPLDARYLGLGAIAIAAVLLARYASVGGFLALMRPLRRFPRGMVTVLTWAGLRGGISIALALSIPAGDLRNALVTATYVVVVFSILVQGLTLQRVIVRATRLSGGDPK